MAKDRRGFLIDADGNYTFKIGDTRQQEAYLITGAHQGEFKHYPLVGCNPSTWKDYAGGKQGVIRNIKQQYEADGLRYEDFQVQIESNL